MVEREGVRREMFGLVNIWKKVDKVVKIIKPFLKEVQDERCKKMVSLKN